MITVRLCGEAAAMAYGVRWTDVVSARRDHSVMPARQLGMYLARHHTAASLPVIGRVFGGRDHTTVLHAVRKIEAAIGDEAAAGLRAMMDAALAAIHRHAGPTMTVADLDPLRIADRVMSSPNGATLISIREIRALAETVWAVDQHERWIVEPSETEKAATDRLTAAIERVLAADDAYSLRRYSAGERAAHEALSREMQALRSAFNAISHIEENP